VRDSPHIPSENFILTFSEEITDRVFVAAMSYRVQVCIPSSIKCKKCHRLGHTISRCGSSSTSCRNCGKPQHPGQECSTFYINCDSKTQGSDSNACPAYSEMKQIIKMAFLEGITIKEARERFNAISSSATRRGHHCPPTPKKIQLAMPTTVRKSFPSKSRSRYCSKK
jgi:hypothetical protein